MLLALDKVDRPKRSPIGLWDENILCAACEAKFAVIDGYAFEHLIGGKKTFYVCRDANGTLMLDGALPVAIYTHASPDKLLSFAISVLWRSSVSERPEIEGTKTVQQDKFRDCLFTGNYETFELAMCRETNSKFHGFVCVVGDWKIDGVCLQRFSAGGYMFLVRERPQPTPTDIDVLFWRCNGYQTALCRSELESAFATQMSESVRSIRSAFGTPWRRSKISDVN